MNAEVEALCKKMTQDRFLRLLEGLQGIEPFIDNKEATAHQNVNTEKMATYAEVISDTHLSQVNTLSEQTNIEKSSQYSKPKESSDPSDLVKPIFSKNQDVHGSEKPPRAQWLTNVEIFKSISAKVPKQCIKGIQRIREMWRIYMDNEGDRLSLLVQGLNLRGRQVPLHSQNPHNPSTLQKDTIRIKVKNIPLSADDGQIHRALTLQGCEIQGLFREYLRIDGKMTACETGDRLVISKTLDKPIPRNLPIGRYFGRIFHAGQPEFQNNNTGEREERTCHKCLKPGHMLFQCPNDWVCKICKESGHKMIDCPKHFQTVDEHDHDEARQQPENDNIASVDNTDQDENVDHTELEVPTIPPAKKQSEKKPNNSKASTSKTVAPKRNKDGNSDNVDKAQPPIDRFVRTPHRRIVNASDRSPPTPTEALHDKTSGNIGTKKIKDNSNV
ncbi:unnamed protein product [Mytilus edulis]|uniref:CCHC-type domain-containing protein n=1 Tax=Mytilus edulis TaxID=6550 RepID=A0A8S3Q4Z1_MYTED|nr:unnamed protein product [Mytilus edulis]